ncbi:hypothetical protein FocnCong_v010965 [Fusarium oxysporum f. sp. conglutinans]|nr:hypothetical protein FocnCong_v010965 [Fusarium oxysporum f. sp. conglutinans]
MKVAVQNARVTGLEEQMAQVRREKKRKAIPNPNRRFMALAEAIAALEALHYSKEAEIEVDVDEEVESVIEVGVRSEDEHTSLCHRDMASFLYEEFQVTVSHHCISRNLRKAGWSRKTMQNVAKERNVDLREEHIYELSDFRSCQLLFIEEPGMDGSLGILKKGYARRGQRPRQVKKFHCGRGVQVLSALGQDGVIHFRVYGGSTDAEISRHFIKEFLPYYGRWSEPRSVLVMDNASFHLAEEIQWMCEEAGLMYKLQSLSSLI